MDTYELEQLQSACHNELKKTHDELIAIGEQLENDFPKMQEILFEYDNLEEQICEDDSIPVIKEDLNKLRQAVAKRLELDYCPERDEDFLALLSKNLELKIHELNSAQKQFAELQEKKIQMRPELEKMQQKFARLNQIKAEIRNRPQPNRAEYVFLSKLFNVTYKCNQSKNQITIVIGGKTDGENAKIKKVLQVDMIKYNEDNQEYIEKTRQAFWEGFQ